MKGMPINATGIECENTNTLYSSASLHNSLGNICGVFWNQQALFFCAPPTTDVFMYFQFITVFACWDVVWLCHYGTIQHVLRTGARLFPVVRVWKFPLHTTALSQCCCSTAGQDTRSFPSPLQQGGGTSSLLPSLHPPTTRTQWGPCPLLEQSAFTDSAIVLHMRVIPWRL